ncbi:MAG: DUF971 domain-containing protein [Gammaproteobacteria bacterium]|nr:DUF971 domain-containing protein [Gammaproteobacteria bacterium]
MSKTPRPTDIKLHQKSRKLEVSFDDGKTFEFPCEFLRVFSPSAEVQGHGPGEDQLQTGKKNANITKIEMVGNYAIQPTFEDGHDSGIFSWETLYNYGVKMDEMWQSYLDRLEKEGGSREPAPGVQAIDLSKVDKVNRPEW